MFIFEELSLFDYDLPCITFFSWSLFLSSRVLHKVMSFEIEEQLLDLISWIIPNSEWSYWVFNRNDLQDWLQFMELCRFNHLKFTFVILPNAFLFSQPFFEIFLDWEIVLIRFSQKGFVAFLENNFWNYFVTHFIIYYFFVGS